MLRGICSRRARFLAAVVKARLSGHLFTANLDKALFVFISSPSPGCLRIVAFTVGLGKGENFLSEREGGMRSIPVCAEKREWRRGIKQSPQGKTVAVAYPSDSPLDLAQNLETLQQEVIWE